MSTDQLIEAIAHRRSMGLSKLKADPIPREMVEKMLEAANWAPSNEDTEPWRFVVFSGEGRHKLADLYALCVDLPESDPNYETAVQGYRDRAFAAPLWIAIIVEPKLDDEGSYVVPLEEEYIAAGCAANNIHTVAASYGLAGMWHSKGVSVHPEVAAGLGVKEPGRLLGFFFFGYPNCDWPSGERGPIDEKVTWVEA